MTGKRDLYEEAETITTQRLGPIPPDNTHQCIIAGVVVIVAPWIALMFANVRGDKVEIALIVAGFAVGGIMRWSNRNARNKWFGEKIAVYDRLRREAGELPPK